MESIRFELPKIEFPLEQMKLNVTRLKEDYLALTKANSLQSRTPKSVLEVYGELYFPKLEKNRPYTFSSIVLSFDGKMAYEDDPQGPFVASKNMLDPIGGLTDFWILNVLRAYADAVIVGAKTMQNEPDMTAHVFDADLEESRLTDLNKENRIPTNIIISFDATDIPLEHKLFQMDKYPVMIATSPTGAEYLKKHFQKQCEYLEHINTVDELTKITAKHTDNKLYVISTGEGSKPNTKVMLALLKHMGVELLVVESPTFTGHLLAQKALDEWFINYSSVYVGGNISPCVSQPMSVDHHPHAHLVTLGTHKSNFIFTRQLIEYDSE